MDGMVVSKARLLDALMRNDFLSFAARAFRELNPNKKLVHAWYHEAVADVLRVVAISKEINHAIITLPPRSLKSETVSVALPAFPLGRDPCCRIIVVSYNQDLANDLSRKTRAIMQSDWYHRLFPSTQLVGRAAETQFYTTAGGFRMATSTGGTLTGKGGDLVIVDDPLKADDAYSKAARDAAAQWAKRTLFTRLDDTIRGGIIVVQQRLHEDDLAGQLAKTGTFLELSLPAVAEKEEWIYLARGAHKRAHVRQPGDLLDPVRLPRDHLAALKLQLGSEAYVAQYQQKPVPPEGNVIKIAWLRPYDTVPPGGQRILSIDTASKAGLRNDYSVAMLWRVIENRFYLENVWRRRIEFPELLQLTVDLARSYAVDTILIEDKGAGTGLIQTLNDMPEGFPVVAFDPKGLDKELRMRVKSHMIEGGQVFIPREAPWLDDFLDEVCRFPNGSHDDQIDAMSQALEYGSSRRKDFWIQSFSGERIF